MENIEEKGLEADSHISKRIEVVSHRAARQEALEKYVHFFLENMHLIWSAQNVFFYQGRLLY